MFVPASVVEKKIHSNYNNINLSTSIFNQLELNIKVCEIVDKQPGL